MTFVSPLSGQIDRAATHRLLARCQRRTFERKEVLADGAPQTRVLYILRGRLRAEMVDPDNRRWTLGDIGPGDFFGEWVLFSPIPSHSLNVALHALEAGELAYIDGSALLALLEGELASDATSVLSLLGSQMARRFWDVSVRANQMACLNVHDRVWCALQRLAASPEALSHPHGVQVKVSRQDLATAVGCSRDAARMVIRQLVDEGRLKARGKTMVLYRLD